MPCTQLMGSSFLFIRDPVEVRLTPADKPEVKKDEEDRQRFNRITNK